MKTRHKNLQKKLLSVLVLSACLSPTRASEEIEISSILSNGASASYDEAAPNLWFLLDNSGSMGIDGTNSPRQREIAGWGLTTYDASIIYQVPYDLNGNQMPKPSVTDSTESQLHYYTQPFKDAADGKAHTDYADSTRTDSGLSDATNKLNYSIWYSYYRSRMLTLKSTMSLSFFKPNPSEEELRMRVGYMALHEHNEITEYGEYDYCNTPANKKNFPVKPLYTTAGDDNREAMQKWVYNLCSYNGTPLRGRASELYASIYKNSLAPLPQSPGSKTNNPFVSDPEKAYDAQTNPILSCRRNYVVMLTDGEWNITSDVEVENNLSFTVDGVTKSFPKTDGEFVRPVNTYTLPDNTTYSPLSPYKNLTGETRRVRQWTGNYILETRYRIKKVWVSDPRWWRGGYWDYVEEPYQERVKEMKWVDTVIPGPYTLGDLAFLGWITDIDGKANNNDLTEKVTKVNDVIQSNHGSPYWHPYNDYADWQHINTFTIGFDLDKSSVANSISTTNRNVSINPPPEGTSTGGIAPKFLEDDFAWEIEFSRDGKEIKSSSLQGDLANAAVNGRGRFYNVQSVNDMISAFDDIAKQSTKGGEIPSVRGSGGVTGSNQSLGSAYYSSRYDVDSFTGELERTNLYDGSGNTDTLNACFKNPGAKTRYYGEICDKAAWNASTLLTAKPSGERNIISMKRTYNENDLTATTADAMTDINKLDYAQVLFRKNNLTPYMKKRLKDNFPDVLENNYGNNSTRLTKLINYIRGDGSEEGVLFRSRQYPYTTNTTARNVLGAIMRSSPVLSGAPMVNASNPAQRSSDYLKFVKRYLYKKTVDNSGNATYTSLCTTDSGCSNPIHRDYVEMIYVGSNDGMLHAFKATTGEEVFSYIPNAVYDKLPLIVEKDEKVSLVDGNLDVQTVNINDSLGNTEWKKVLVGAMGGGARGLYALDVTDPKYSTDKKYVKWEYSVPESKLFNRSGSGKSNIGNIIAKPGIVQLGDGTWAAVVGNGYNSESEKAVLIVINLETGRPIQELVLENEDDKYTDSNLPNGLGPVFFAAYAGKTAATASFVDRGYAGDLQGNLWVFDFTNSTKDGGITVAKTDGQTKQIPLFTAKYKKRNSDGTYTEIRQPITTAPLVRVHPKNYGNIVHFGTGSLFHRNDLSSTIKNSVYAVWDDWIPYANGGLSTPRTGTPVVVDRTVSHNNQLKEVVFENLSGTTETTVSSDTITARVLKRGDNAVNQPISWAFSGTDFTLKKRGWYVDLLAGERAWQPAYNSYGSEGAEAIGYNTVRYLSDSGVTVTDTACKTSQSSVESWTLAFNPDDGTKKLFKSGTLDTNKDGLVDKNDKIERIDTTIDANGNPVDTTTQRVVTGIKQSTIALNGANSTLTNNEYADPADRLCKQVSEILVYSDADSATTSKVVCRASYIGAWGELR